MQAKINRETQLCIAAAELIDSKQKGMCCPALGRACELQPGPCFCQPVKDELRELFGPTNCDAHKAEFWNEDSTPQRRRLRVLALLFLAWSLNADAAFNCQQVTYAPSEQTVRFDSVSWRANVGDAPPVMPDPPLDGWTVDFACAANGAELEYIYQKFSGIPMRGKGSSRTIVWSGDDAHFILDNL